MYASIPDNILENFWIWADILGTPIISWQRTETKRTSLYYLVLAHLCELYKRGPGAVGMITTATEGTTTVGFEVNKSNSLIFWNQTSWGMIIALLMKRRGGFQFIPGRVRNGSLFN